MSREEDDIDDEFAKDQIRFCLERQNKYVLTNPELSEIFKGIVDEYRDVLRENARFRKLVANLEKKKRENFTKDGQTKVSIWD